MKKDNKRSIGVLKKIFKNFFLKNPLTETCIWCTLGKKKGGYMKITKRTIAVRISEDLAELLERIARRECRTRSSLVEWIVKKEFERAGLIPREEKNEA